MNERNLNEYTQIAYKKLKNSVFYDKTAAVTRNQIVYFERDAVDKKLNKIAYNIENLSESDWQDYQKKILNSIKVLILPKKINKNKNTSNFIINKNTENKIKIDEFQYFIDMCVEGHILGVLWIILFGRYLDNKKTMYKHSYGNRLRSTLFDDNKEVSFYPGLFEPYFSQYTTWRDTGIDIAQREIKEGNNVIILTMDFKRFYYSVSYTKNEFDEIFNNIKRNNFPIDLDNGLEVLNRLHSFVYSVIEKYSAKLRSVSSKEEELWDCGICEESNSINVLPIGFLPSNILANYRLNIFDQHIITRWNPLYYGRYVDDIIIVDKIDKNSIMYDKIFVDKCEADGVISYFFANCNATKCDACVSGNDRSLLLKNDEDHNFYYYINPNLLVGENINKGMELLKVNTNSRIRV